MSQKISIKKRYPNKLVDAFYKMYARCNNPNNKSYKRYGAKGITTAWSNVEDFCEQMFDKFNEAVKIYGEENISLDRIDSTGNYCYENCRFIDYKGQSRNRCTNTAVILTNILTGEEREFGTIIEASEFLNIPYDQAKYMTRTSYCLNGIYRLIRVRDNKHIGILFDEPQFSKEYLSRHKEDVKNKKSEFIPKNDFKRNGFGIMPVEMIAEYEDIINSLNSIDFGDYRFLCLLVDKNGIYNNNCLLYAPLYNDYIVRSVNCSLRYKKPIYYQDPNEIKGYRDISPKKLKTTYSGAKGRCKPNAHCHDAYYDKGIKFEWNCMEDFCRDLLGDYLAASIKYGEENISLDRIDNSKGYNSENCRFISNAEQYRNMTNTTPVVLHDIINNTKIEFSTIIGCGEYLGLTPNQMVCYVGLGRVFNNRYIITRKNELIPGIIYEK